MESKGRIQSFTPHYGRNTTTVILELETTDIDTLAALEKQQKGDVKVTVKSWREARTRNANSYFYVLVEKLADALRVSKPYIHNLMLRKYGQLQRIDGKPVWVILPETDEVAKKVDEDETLHVRATDEVKQGKDGRIYRTYLLLKGSHELNTQEFSILLDGIISDCHEANVSTATPEEIQMMKERWNVEVNSSN